MLVNRKEESTGSVRCEYFHKEYIRMTFVGKQFTWIIGKHGANLILLFSNKSPALEEAVILKFHAPACRAWFLGISG